MYKKMALELHPDKGGDPEKFQELQEMKELQLSDARSVEVSAEVTWLALAGAPYRFGERRGGRQRRQKGHGGGS